MIKLSEIHYRKEVENVEETELDLRIEEQEIEMPILKLISKICNLNKINFKIYIVMKKLKILIWLTKKLKKISHH
jgi:hypothetical protein